MTTKKQNLISIENLTLAYDGRVVVRDINFTVNRGDIFVIMGMSGCGKSTIMRSMIGLAKPVRGRIVVDGIDIWATDDNTRAGIIGNFGISYQGGALFSSMTVRENVALPLVLKQELGQREIDKRVDTILRQVGLGGYENLYPNEISGGMIKRTALARALVMEPSVLFFDEPSAGLDPVRAAELDNLIRDINHKTGTTVVMVTHELPTIMTIANNSVYIDAATQTVGAAGAPKHILKTTKNHGIIEFLTRNETYRG